MMQIHSFNLIIPNPISAPLSSLLETLKESWCNKKVLSLSFRDGLNFTDYEWWLDNPFHTIILEFDGEEYESTRKSISEDSWKSFKETLLANKSLFLIIFSFNDTYGPLSNFNLIIDKDNHSKSREMLNEFLKWTENIEYRMFRKRCISIYQQ